MDTAGIIRFGAYALDLDRGELTRDGAPVRLEPQVYDLIRFLAQNPDRLISRDELVAEVWQGRFISDAAISTRMNAARKALGDDGTAQRVIRTMPRRGFRFVAQVETMPSPPAPAAAPPAEPLPLPDRPSVVVMPFEALDGGASASLAQGLRMDIQNALVKVAGVMVIAAGSANAVADRPMDEAGRLLGVRHLLQGQVMSAGDTVRFAVQLVEASAERVVWSEQFDRPLADTFRVLDEVTAEVLTALNVTLLAGDSARVWHKTLTDLRALQVFYRGIEAFFRMSRASMRAARRDFENIARHQPELSLGPTWVALTHWYDLQRGWADDPEESKALARDWALRGAGFEDADGQAATVLSHIHLLDRDFDAALAAGAEAVRNRPNCTHANGFYANVLHYCGAQDRALTHISRAIRHSPYHPPMFDLVLGLVRRARGESAAAFDTVRTAQARAPEDLAALVSLAVLAQESGKAEVAAEAAATIRRLQPDFAAAAYLAGLPYRDAAMPNDMRAALEALDLGG